MMSINLSRERSLSTAASERALDLARRDLARLQEQMSTGRRVNRASDDAPAYAQARQMERLSNRYAQYLRSIDGAQSWVDHTQDALNGIADRLAEAFERGLRTKSESFNADNLDAEASRIESILAEAVDTLNGKHGDAYIFAGTNTTVRPFDQTPGGVVYNGNGAGIARQIGDDQRLDINIAGDSVHDTGAGFTITESLQDLADAMRSGDVTLMEAALERVATSRDHVIDKGAEAGGIANRMDLAATQLRDATLRVETRRSQLEDVDMAEAIMDYQRTQTSFEAALKVTASVLQTSLLDYLR